MKNECLDRVGVIFFAPALSFIGRIMIIQKIQCEVYQSFCGEYSINVHMKKWEQTGVLQGRQKFHCGRLVLKILICGWQPLITGTLWVSFFAILFALPFGLSVAVYMSEVADHRTRSFLKPVIELLSGIPSVVYGFFGLIVIVPLIQKVFNLPVGDTDLAGSNCFG